MKYVDFQNLKIGDICVFTQGHDKGKKCRVVYIDEEVIECASILVKAYNCEFAKTTARYNPYLRLTNYTNLDICDCF